ncbi:hypothetical protein [Aliidiomarina maris]|uniref:Uncharacterized protein n=1 Tax=Aliidiomarina maris TaxID=531312 RepID=A0A327X0H6_9GAMM|nr:hypothetical protein [Aliidiomarina maris]RAJ98466.1 hypothetical protein B0I24_105219 [Aliidiomarina maris]RUO24724.1 hypothetical protein CWE07_06670 [Aliidiomarina maris]
MSLYFSPELVEQSFNRLTPVSTAGKKSLERTSALMYFIAFAATISRLGVSSLDMNPRTFEGKTNRQAMELEYVKLVQLKSFDDGVIRHVSVLGKIDIGGKHPEKRISSNFFTVPLTKASKSTTEYDYPSRPAPIMKMGLSATQIKWGLSYHSDRKKNLPKLFTEFKSNTPFTDLAVFVSRYDSLPEKVATIHEALTFVIRDRFEEDFANFWLARINSEKIFFRPMDQPFSSTFSDALVTDNNFRTSSNTDEEALRALEKGVLEKRVIYLESLLDAQDIKYQPIIEE